MLYDLSGLLPFVAVLAVLAVVGGAVAATVIGQTVAGHHRARVARHESIPTYYRRFVLAH